MSTVFTHESVMPYEVVKYLGPQPGDIIVDGTLGGGGHAGLILERILPKGILVGIDQDKEAIEAAEKKLSGFKKNTKVIQGNFKDIGKILTELKIDQVDGILLDLGISMHQILTPERGFGFYPSPENLKSPLDMRMNTETGITAADILNTWKERDLTELFFKLGDEKYSRSIAMQIVRRRPLETVGDLLEAIKAGTQPSYRAKSLKNKWAANVFRALRMEVNNELGVIKEGIEGGLKLLRSGGKMVVITFHSIEDRLVKEIFKELTLTENYQPGFGLPKEPSVAELVTKKPVSPTESEIRRNPAARSAKLRIIKKL